MEKTPCVKWKTLEKGIRKYDHPTRKHGVKADMYFALRYTADGKRREEGLGWASEGWTLAKAREILAQLRLAHATGQGEITLQERREKAALEREAEANKPTIARLWQIYRELKGNYSSLVTDTSSFKHFAVLHDRLPETIRTHELTAIVNELQGQGLAPMTVKNALELLRRLINFGAKQELCTRPAGLHFNMPQIDNQKTECLTPEQARALIEALDADPDQNLANLMRLALVTGMRRGALLALQWADIDFERGFITLRGEVAKSGKTQTIPLTAAAKAILENTPPQRSAFVFPGKDGKKRVEIRRFLNRIRIAAKLPEGFRPLHGLRHTYASWLASSGEVTLLELQTLMTHNSPQMTMRYAHLADKAIRKAADVINDCLDVAANAEAAHPQGARVIPFKTKT